MAATVSSSVVDISILTVTSNTKTVTFTFSEPVTGFDSEDVLISNDAGEMGAVSSGDGGKTWTGTFTAKPGFTGSTNLSVTDDYTDSNDSAGTAGGSLTLTIDTMAPTVVSIAAADADLNVNDATEVVTFTFSEEATGFAASDVTISNNAGVLGDLTSTDFGKTWTGTFTANAGFTGSTTLSVTGPYTDLVSNAGSAGGSKILTIDMVAPTVTSITAADTDLNVTDTSEVVTFTFSEAVSGFSASDVLVTGPGSLDTLSSTDGGLTWTGTFTAPVGQATSTTLSVTGPYADLAANAGSGGGSLQLTIDTLAPTVTSIAALDADLNVIDTSEVVTFTFSEAVSGFSASDVLVTGPGSLGVVSSTDGGLTWTGTFTAPVGQTGSTTLSVTGPYADLAANAGSAGGSLQLTIDTLAPTVTSIAAADTDFNVIDTSEVVTFTFSEAVTGFSASDVLVTGPGSLDTLSTTDGGLTWTGTFTAPAGLTGSTTLSVTGPYADLAANAGSAGGSLQLTIDRLTPTVTVNLASTAFSNTNPSSQVTFTLSEASADFVLGDVTVTGGSIGDLTTVDNLTYTGTFTATPNSTTPVSISVLPGRFTDAAGNANFGSLTDTATVDTVAPTVTSIAAADTDLNVTDASEVVTFTFSEAVTGFSASDVLVTGPGSLGVVSSTDGGLTWTGTFTAPVGQTASTTLSVTGPYTDLATNAGSTGGSKILTIDTLAPTVTVDLASTAFSDNAATSEVTFTLSEISGDFDKSDVQVLGGTLSDLVTIDGKVYTGTVTANQNSTTPVSVSVAAGAFTDGAGNANTVSLTDTATVDTVNPTVALLTISDDGGASNSDHITRDRTLSVSGTVEAGSTVTVAVLDLGGNPVLVNGTPVTLVATVTGGTFTTASTPSLLDGSYIFRATATDAAGNTTTSDLSPVRVDNTTALPTFGLAAASDTGVSATDLLTKDTTPDFTGTAEAGATVQIFLDGSIIGTAVAAQDNTYTLAFADSDLNGFPLTDGSHTLTALVTDLAGNTKLSPTVTTFTVDATPPTATVAFDKSKLSDGTNTSTVTFTFSEAVDPASLVVFATGGTVDPTSIVVAANGLSATATFTAADNSVASATVALTAFKDLAGNTGAPIAATPIAVDTVNPTATVVIGDASFSDGNLTSTVTFTFTEAVDPASLVLSATGGSVDPASIVFSNGGLTATATFTATDDSTTAASVTLTAFKDLAGNAGTSTASAPVTVDTVNPTATVVIGDASFSDGNLTSPVTFTFTEAVDPTSLVLSATGGTVDPASIVFSNGGLTATATFTATDNSTTDAKVTLTAFKDLVGNAGTSTASAPVTVDTVNPTVTIAFDKTSLSDSSPTTTVTFTFAEAVDPTSLVVNATGGTVDPASIVVAANGLSATATFTATEDSVAEASVTLTAFKDLAGNAGGAKEAGPVTVDTRNPTATVVIGDASFSDGNLTSPVTFTFSEAVDPASLVLSATGGSVDPASIVFSNGGLTATATFTATDDSTTAASVTLTAFKDLAGNAGTSTASAPVTVDTVNPTATVVIEDASFSDGNLTSPVTFTFTEAVDPTSLVLSATGGTVDPASIVFSNGGLTATATFTATDNSTTDAKVTLTAFKDLVGNAGTSAASAPVTVDTVNPTVTIAFDKTSLSDSSPTTTVTFTFAEAVDPTSLVVNATGGTVDPASIVVAANGLSATATFTAAEDSVAEASVTLTAFKDLAGNIGGAKEAGPVTVDTRNPTATVVIGDASFSDGNLTSPVTFTFSEAVDPTSLVLSATGGTVDPASIVFSNGGLTATATFTATDNSTTAASVTLTAFKDLAGNAGTSTASAPVTVDTVNPTATVVIEDASFSDGNLTSTVTFTFTEAVDPTSLVLSATGGSVDPTSIVFSNGGLTATATFTATDSSTTDAKVTLTAFKDLAGNAGTSTASAPVTVDTVNPTVISITAADQSLNVAGKTTTVTFTFSEAVQGFDASDVAYDTSTGTLGALTSSDGITWTGEFTAKAGITGTTTLSIGGNAAAYTDQAGNTGVHGGELNLAIDTSAPTISGFTISTDNGLSGTDKITRDNTLTVSGSVTGVANNTEVEVVVSFGGETVTTLTGTVLNGVFTTNVSPILASPGATGREYTFSASVTDANGNITTESFKATIDRTTTVATIGLASGSDQGVPGDGITSNATPDFFGTAEAGATVDVFLDDELIGTAVANESGQFIVSFAESGLEPLSNGTYTLTTSSTDIAGNIKQDLVGKTFTIDRTAPTATITLSDTSLVAGETATVTITFSEAVAGFALGDLVSGNGELRELSGPTAGPNGSVIYTATLIPTANSEDSTNVVTLSTGYTDVAGNTGTTASTGNFTVDTLAPTVLSVAASGPGITDGSGTLVTGQTVSFTFTMSEAVIVSTGDELAIRLSNGATAVYNALKSTGTLLVFDYTVLVDQISSDLAVTGISLNGAVITDANGNPFDASGSAINPDGILKIDGYTGTSGSETFRGTNGAETFTGLGGADTYMVDNIGDQVIEAVGGDIDTVRTSVNFALGAGQGIEVLRGSGTVGLALTGNEFDNRIVGTSGNDVIDGKAGVDALFGGLGDDTYSVDNANDQVTEAAQAGNDTVYASVSYVLKAGQEIETLEGIGSTGLTLTGNNFANKIVGTTGNDILDGKTGADTLSGGDGNDTYYVDNANDHLIETIGTDTVYASVNYTLETGVEIEALRVLGSKGLTLTGNEFANTIVGGAGKDVIVGGLGQDTLVGGAGNDTFVFKTVSDSGNGIANRDAILDFRAGFDHLDLSGIQAVSGAATDQSFSFIEGAFTKHKGELHAVVSGSSTTIEGDVDGNGKADFQIILRGTIEALHANDFVL